MLPPLTSPLSPACPSWKYCWVDEIGKFGLVSASVVICGHVDLFSLGYSGLEGQGCGVVVWQQQHSEGMARTHLVGTTQSNERDDKLTRDDNKTCKLKTGCTDWSREDGSSVCVAMPHHT